MMSSVWLNILCLVIDIVEESLDVLVPVGLNELVVNKVIARGKVKPCV